MDVAEWIHHVRAGGNAFAVDVRFGAYVPPHGRVWLGDAQRLPDDRVEDWR